MGGPSKADKESQRQTAALDRQFMQSEIGLQNRLVDQSDARTKRMDTLQQPAIDFYSKMASGDKGTMLSAAAPAIANITAASKASKANIMDQMPAGAARDFAISQIDRQAPSQVSGFLNNQYLSAFDKMANIGSGMGAFSLQQLGAGLRAGEGGIQAGNSAVNTTNSVMQADAAKKATTMGFFGQLAQAAGMGVGGM